MTRSRAVTSAGATRTPRPSCKALWLPGQPNTITRGAVMMFEHDNDLAVDGIAGPHVWKQLIADVVAGKDRRSGYSYVYVHRSLPQSLNLWVDGQTILSSPGNTGVPQAPTALGTYPVFEHIPIGTMSGHEPGRQPLPRPGHPLDQLLPRRRRDPLLQPRLLRDAPEPRLRRAADRGRREGLAVHADRDAGHGRELRPTAPSARGRGSPSGALVLGPGAALGWCEPPALGADRAALDAVRRGHLHLRQLARPRSRSS